MNTKKDIRALSKDDLRLFFEQNGDKAFRANQVYDWLWSKGVHSFDQMTNLSKETRLMLDNHFVINHIKVDTMQRSEDGTTRWAFCRICTYTNRNSYNCLCIKSSRL